MTLPKRTSRTTQWRLHLGERRALVVLGDLFMAGVSLVVGIGLWAIADIPRLPIEEFLRTRLQWWFFALPILWALLLVDSYDPHKSDDLRRTFRAVGAAALLGLVAYMAIYFTSEPNSLPRRGVAAFLLSAFALTLIWRFIYIQVFTAPRFLHRVLLVGAGSTGQALLSVLNDIWPPPYYLAGLIDDDPEKQGQEMLGYTVLGSSDNILDIVARESISDIIVAISGFMQSPMFQALLDAQTRGVQITRMPVAYEELLGRVPVQHLEADWILRNFVDEARVGAFYRMGKRLLDILGGLVGVAILVLIGPIIAVAIFLEDGAPVVFQQMRAGQGNIPYKIYKFRTMVKDAEKGGQPQLAQENDERATRVGRILRKTHLDEWLQFINVLRGEMSLVGPRPERPEFVEHFQREIPFYRARLLVKPGIAGWAQIHFAYAATLEEMVMKLEYDLYYIKHRNLWLDVVILLRTVATVIGFRGR